MNVSSNNLRGFSQYSLLNKPFSQKNGNNSGVSKQADAKETIEGELKRLRTEGGERAFHECL